MLPEGVLQPKTARQQKSGVLKGIAILFPLVWRICPNHLCTFIVLKLLQAFHPLYQIYLTKRLFDAASNVIIYGEAHLPSAIYTLGIQLSLILGVLLLKLFEFQVITAINNHCEHEFSKIYFKKISSLALISFENSEIHNKIYRASQGQYGKVIGAIEMFINTFKDIVTLTGYVMIIAKFNFVLSFGPLLLIFPYFYAHMQYGRNRYKELHNQADINRQAGYIASLLGNKDVSKEIRLFGTFNFFISRWSELFWRKTRQWDRIVLRANYGSSMIDALGNIMNTVSIIYLLWWGSTAHITIGEYASLALAITSIQGLLFSTVSALLKMYEDNLHVMDYLEFMDLPDEKKISYSTKFPNKIEAGITVKNLTFYYPSATRPSLADISFTVKKGQKVAIVGENGCGKTTLAKCLLGLYTPQQGDIFFDQLNIKEIDIEDFRQNVSAIFQDFIRYQFKIKDNITLRQILDERDHFKMIQAAEQVGADDFVKILKDGYDTDLGFLFQNGQDLSIGQWQKLAMARALYKDAPIIVLDEPTASLDPIVEAEIFENFHNLSKGKITFIISHRLGCCRTADVILVLKTGKLVEIGSHQELMNLNGEYATIFNSQAQWYN